MCKTREQFVMPTETAEIESIYTLFLYEYHGTLTEWIRKIPSKFSIVAQAQANEKPC